MNKVISQCQIPPLLLILQCKLSESIFYEVDFYISRFFSLFILSGFSELQTTVHLAQMPQLQSMVFVSTFLLRKERVVVQGPPLNMIQEDSAILRLGPDTLIMSWEDIY